MTMTKTDRLRRLAPLILSWIQRLCEHDGCEASFLKTHLLQTRRPKRVALPDRAVWPATSNSSGTWRAYDINVCYCWRAVPWKEIHLIQYGGPRPMGSKKHEHALLRRTCDDYHNMFSLLPTFCSSSLCRFGHYDL